MTQEQFESRIRKQQWADGCDGMWWTSTSAEVFVSLGNKLAFLYHMTYEDALNFLGEAFAAVVVECNSK